MDTRLGPLARLPHGGASWDAGGRPCRRAERGAAPHRGHARPVRPAVLLHTPEVPEEFHRGAVATATRRYGNYRKAVDELLAKQALPPPSACSRGGLRLGC